MTIALHIRQGHTLVLRNTPLYVSSHDVAQPLLGLPLLEGLGFDTKPRHSRLHVIFDCEADVAELLDVMSTLSGNLARLMES